MTKAERHHMSRVADFGCALCMYLGLGPTPCIIHHVRTTVGWGRDGNYNVIGLCPPHHQHSGFGVHDMGRQQFANMYGISEVGLLEWLRGRL
jgi:hypothetical protein